MSWTRIDWQDLQVGDEITGTWERQVIYAVTKGGSMRRSKKKLVVRFPARHVNDRWSVGVMDRRSGAPMNMTQVLSEQLGEYAVLRGEDRAGRPFKYEQVSDLVVRRR